MTKKFTIFGTWSVEMWLMLRYEPCLIVRNSSHGQYMKYSLRLFRMQLLFAEKSNNFKFNQICKKILTFMSPSKLSMKIYYMNNLMILYDMNINNILYKFDQT